MQEKKIQEMGYKEQEYLQIIWLAKIYMVLPHIYNSKAILIDLLR